VRLGRSTDRGYILQVIKNFNKTILLSTLIMLLSLYRFSGVHRVEQLFPHFDKIVHFLMYLSISGAILFEGYIRIGRMDKRIFLLNLYPLILGGSLELIQKTFTVYRSGDWCDFIADVSGILAANIFFYLLKDVKFFRNIIRFPF